MDKPKPPEMTYALRGIGWPWWPAFLYEGYHKRGDYAYSLDGKKICKLPKRFRNAS